MSNTRRVHLSSCSFLYAHLFWVWSWVLFAFIAPHKNTVTTAFALRAAGARASGAARGATHQKKHFFTYKQHLPLLSAAATVLTVQDPQDSGGSSTGKHDQETTQSQRQVGIIDSKRDQDHEAPGAGTRTTTSTSLHYNRNPGSCAYDATSSARRFFHKNRTPGKAAGGAGREGEAIVDELIYRLPAQPSAQNRLAPSYRQLIFPSPMEAIRPRTGKITNLAHCSTLLAAANMVLRDTDIAQRSTGASSGSSSPTSFLETVTGWRSVVVPSLMPGGGAGGASGEHQPQVPQHHSLAAKTGATPTPTSSKSVEVGAEATCSIQDCLQDQQDQMLGADEGLQLPQPDHAEQKSTSTSSRSSQSQTEAQAATPRSSFTESGDVEMLQQEQDQSKTDGAERQARPRSRGGSAKMAVLHLHLRNSDSSSCIKKSEDAVDGKTEPADPARTKGDGFIMSSTSTLEVETEIPTVQGLGFAAPEVPEKGERQRCTSPARRSQTFLNQGNIKAKSASTGDDNDEGWTCSGSGGETTQTACSSGIMRPAPAGTSTSSRRAVQQGAAASSPNNVVLLEVRDLVAAFQACHDHDVRVLKIPLDDITTCTSGFLAGDTNGSFSTAFGGGGGPTSTPLATTTESGSAHAGSPAAELDSLEVESCNHHAAEDYFFESAAISSRTAPTSPTASHFRRGDESSKSIKGCASSSSSSNKTTRPSSIDHLYFQLDQGFFLDASPPTRAPQYNDRAVEQANLPSGSDYAKDHYNFPPGPREMRPRDTTTTTRRSATLRTSSWPDDHVVERDGDEQLSPSKTTRSPGFFSYFCHRVCKTKKNESSNHAISFDSTTSTQHQPTFGVEEQPAAPFPPMITEDAEEGSAPATSIARTSTCCKNRNMKHGNEKKSINMLMSGRGSDSMTEPSKHDCVVNFHHDGELHDDQDEREKKTLQIFLHQWVDPVLGRLPSAPCRPLEVQFYYRGRLVRKLDV
ncbi:unnamed protein product [Amoebophrya sp. A120]|nr:unnamed protein product [Amoebophrya sp. A120]|eukprot:GSA120T00000343001.1